MDTTRRNIDDELLQPSLDASHDLAGFAKPFDPGYLPFAVFFAGPLCGGALVAWNWRRLGVHGRAVPALLGFAALWIAMALLLYAAVDRPRFVEEARIRAVIAEGRFELHGGAGGRLDRRSERHETRSFWRFVGRAIALVPALIAARRQKRRYRIHEHAGRRAAPLVGWVLLAVALDFVVAITAATPFVNLLWSLENR